MSPITLPRVSQPELFHEWTAARLAERLDEGDCARAVVTKETWPDERAKRRKMIGEVLVPDWPKPDPKATLVGTIDRPAWKLHKLRFQSLPDYWVTALLYVPTTGKPPYPAMIVASGHLLEAKAAAEYHGISEELARQGMIVLAFDPVSQGERVQRWDYLRNQFLVGWGTTEHDILGHKALLCGWSLAQAFVWDGQRALDVLLSRPEADRTHVGVCGISGGGTQTSWLLAAEDRFTAASPACFITGWREQLAARVGADPEQFPFPANAWGWDQADMLATFAPKPLLLVAATRDFFPIEGTRATYRKLRELYGRLGVRENVGMFEADVDHSYYPPLREATVKWFCAQFGIPYDGKGVSQNPLPPEQLQVTSSGQLITSGFPRTLHDWIIERKPSPKGARVGELVLSQPDAWQSRRRQTLSVLLGIPTEAPAMGGSLVDRSAVDGGTLERWLLVPEPGIELPVALVRPAGEARGLVLYAHESGADVGWRLPGGPLYELVRSGWAVVSVDPRGVGAGIGREEGEFARGYFGRFGVESHLTWTWTMLGRSLFGQRVFDLMQAARWARRQKGLFGLPVGMIGVGVGALWAMVAAALDTRIEKVVAHGPLSDYASILSVHDHPWIVSALVPKMLTWGDLPHVAALISPRELALVAPVGPDRRPVRPTILRRVYRPTREVFKAQGAALRLHLVPADGWAETMRVEYREWLEE